MLERSLRFLPYHKIVIKEAVLAPIKMLRISKNCSLKTDCRVKVSMRQKVGWENIFRTSIFHASIICKAISEHINCLTGVEVYPKRAYINI